MKLTALYTLVSFCLMANVSKAVVFGVADYGNENSTQFFTNPIDPLQNEVDSGAELQGKFIVGDAAAVAVDALSAAKQSMDALKDALEGEKFFKAGDKVVTNTVVTLKGLKSGLDDLTKSLEKQIKKKKKNKNFNRRKKLKKTTPVPTNDFQDDNLLRGLEAAKAASSTKLIRQARAVVGEKLIERLDDAREVTGDNLTQRLQDARDQALDGQLSFADVNKIRNDLNSSLRFGVDGPPELHLY
uniref:Uncharacterized protein n=1 Tax=Glossina austeni TaxID=7395 RepID=A0A1A9V7U4_GLOAU